MQRCLLMLHNLNLENSGTFMPTLSARIFTASMNDTLSISWMNLMTLPAAPQPKHLYILSRSSTWNEAVFS